MTGLILFTIFGVITTAARLLNETCSPAELTWVLCVSHISIFFFIRLLCSLFLSFWRSYWWH